MFPKLVSTFRGDNEETETNWIVERMQPLGSLQGLLIVFSGKIDTTGTILLLPDQKALDISH